MNKHFAFVCPWFGENIPGGAERATRELVLNLKNQDYDVTLLTTCAEDFYNWENVWQPGTYYYEDIPILRFSANQRDAAVFDNVNNFLLSGRTISAQEETIFLQNITSSDELNRFLWRNRNYYTFVFTPYMFGTTYWGLKIVSKKAFLIPCLHDEPYLYLPRYQQMLKDVHRLLFYSEGEAQLASSILKRNKNDSVIGLGLDNNPPPTKEEILAFKDKYSLNKRFIYLPGRKQPEKNTNLAINYFLNYKKRFIYDIQLVFSGPGKLDDTAQEATSIKDLGFISKEEMACAYLAADIVWIPSERESFSFTMFEAMINKTPVLVPQTCSSTRIPVENAAAGWIYDGEDSFFHCLNEIKSNKAELQVRGNRGRDYVLQHHSWEIIINNFSKATKAV